MSNRLKAIFVILMSMALAFGFLHQFINNAPYNFERLHVFLFNLCSGGTIVLYYSEKLERLSLKASLFLFFALCYALCAFLEIYPPAIVCAVVLSILVESIRIKRFSFFPYNFFDTSAPVSEKFNHASLLCLSMGIFISALVIANNEYLKFITIPMLQLDTFFLGFSFPLSLITMSVMFSIMKPDKRSISVFLRNLCFWTVNLGVIIFFLFILMEKLVPQVVVTIILFICVTLIFYIFVKKVERLQQKNFLTSGMVFLLYTAITGILYIVMSFFPAYYDKNSELILKVHAFSSLYGWNLSGLAVICRYKDFPIKLHSRCLIAVHWIIVALLAPIGYYYKTFAILAVPSYFIFLCVLFFSHGNGRQPISEK